MFKFRQTGGEPPYLIKYKKKFKFASEIGLLLSSYPSDCLDFCIKLKVKLLAILWLMFKFWQTGGEPPSSLKMQMLSNKFQFSSEIGPYLSAYPSDWLDFGIEWQKKDRGTSCTMLKFLHLRGELRITKIKIFNMTTQFTINYESLSGNLTVLYIGLRHSYTDKRHS